MDVSVCTTIQYTILHTGGTIIGAGAKRNFTTYCWILRLFQKSHRIFPAKVFPNPTTTLPKIILSHYTDKFWSISQGYGFFNSERLSSRVCSANWQFFFAGLQQKISLFLQSIMYWENNLSVDVIRQNFLIFLFTKILFHSLHIYQNIRFGVTSAKKLEKFELKVNCDFWLKVINVKKITRIFYNHSKD